MPKILNSNNKYKVLSKFISKNARSPFEITFKLINFFSPLSGAVYLIFLDKYSNKEFEPTTENVMLQRNEINELLETNSSRNVNKAIQVLIRVGLIEKTYRRSHYKLNGRTLNDIITVTFRDDNYKYLMENIVASDMKIRKADYFKKKFTKYIDLERDKRAEYSTFMEELVYMIDNGFNAYFEQRYSDISWKTRCKKLSNMAQNFSRGAKDENVVQRFRNKKGSDILHFDNLGKIGKEIKNFLDDVRKNSVRVITPDPIKLSESGRKDALKLLKTHYECIRDLKALIKKEIEEIKKYTISNDIVNKPSIQSSNATDKPSYSKKIVAIELRKAIKKWNSNFVISGDDETKLEETAEHLRKFNIPLKEIFHYGEYVIYEEYLQAKTKSRSSLCGWFRNPKRIENYLKHKSVTEWEDKNSDWEKYKRDHKSSLDRQKKLGNRAGFAYEMTEEELKSKFEFEKLSSEEQREAILKKYDLDREGMKFLRRKMLKTADGVTVPVRYYRRYKDGKIYIQVDGKGLWRKYRLMELLEEDGVYRIDPDLEPNSEE